MAVTAASRGNPLAELGICNVCVWVGNRFQISGDAILLVMHQKYCVELRVLSPSSNGFHDNSSLCAISYLWVCASTASPSRVPDTIHIGHLPFLAETSWFSTSRAAASVHKQQPKNRAKRA